MSLEAIKKIPVQSTLAKDAHLYLWVPNALLPVGLDVMEAWGFRYVSNIVWAKRRKDGGPDGRGVGFYFRNVTELLLFGVRGSMRTLSPGRSQVNMIETRKREHSRKPDEQYNIIESCSPGPYLELFARYPRNGWMSWGNEAPEDITPQGKSYKGYCGGEIWPALNNSLRMAPDQITAIGVRMRKLYDSGASIRDLSAETGYPIQKVRDLLQSAGTTMRSRGRQALTLAAS